MKPIRITLSRKKGWRMPPNTVKVSRPGKWGNPFVVGRDGNAQDCVDQHACLVSDWDEVYELRGKNLACWCKQGEPCHADTLLERANEGGESA